MKILLSFLLFTVTAAFVPQSEERVMRGVVALKMGYVPDGMSPEQYKKLKEKEGEDNKKKRFGAIGPQSFKSRSLQSFQKDLEKGKASHLMPVMNAKDRVKRGELKEEDIPYMQRLGSWDDSDVKNAKKKQWNEDDKKYEQRQKPSGLDWMGASQRRGPTQAKMNKSDNKPQTKKLFGLF